MLVVTDRRGCEASGRVQTAAVRASWDAQHAPPLQKIEQTSWLLQFDFDDLAGGGTDIGEIMGDFGVDVAEIADSDFVRGGLAVR